MIYFTSDPHFSHENILKYCNRPFRDSKEMDYVLLKNLSIIQPEDTLYCLGDFSMRGEDHYKWFAGTLARIAGRKILILGNHDRLKPFSYVELGFESVHTSLTVDKYFLAHDPALLAAMPPEYTMLCGHVHGLFKSQKDDQGRLAINVGVDVWDYKPVSLQEIEVFSKEEANKELLKK
jgi:calcineurin-like phosphoesterase family protein